MDKKTYWKEKEENAEIKLIFASCFKCSKSTYITRGLRIGITLYSYDGEYYCFEHHPYRKQLSRNRYEMDFARAIDKMRKISGIKTGKKKLESRERKIKVGPM